MIIVCDELLFMVLFFVFRDLLRICIVFFLIVLKLIRGWFEDFYCKSGVLFVGDLCFENVISEYG